MANEAVSSHDIQARQVDHMISQEQKHKIIYNRGFTWYKNVLFGLDGFLDFLRTNINNDKCNTLLDIGAGTTKAIKQISESDSGKGLYCMATNLRMNDEIKNNLGEDRTLITSVESLKGIQDFSCIGIISVFGVGYSQLPELAIKNMAIEYSRLVVQLR